MSKQVDTVWALRSGEVFEVVGRPGERFEIPEAGFPADTEQAGSDLWRVGGRYLMRPLWVWFTSDRPRGASIDRPSGGQSGFTAEEGVRLI